MESFCSYSNSENLYEMSQILILFDFNRLIIADQIRFHSLFGICRFFVADVKFVSVIIADWALTCFKMLAMRNFFFVLISNLSGHLVVCVSS